MKKYYIRVTDENGHVIFNHKSDSAKRLLALYNKAAFDPTGHMYAKFYFAKTEKNIPLDVEYAVYCGKNI